MQFSEYKNQPFEAANYHGKPDPFNFPMPNRNDLMRLNSIQADKDGMKTTTFKFDTKRDNSCNLFTSDIDGKLHKIFIHPLFFFRCKPKNSRFKTNRKQAAVEFIKQRY